ncbi:MAG: chromosome segregation protein ScpA [Sphingobacteriales bacterium]|nr:MAG: chromosome segregation protein ScpA [Sphingobacteriales bacterium]
MNDKTYEIKLPQFEGPFDLLLFFIERDELDINDIPIYTITKDFLDYLHQASLMNIELASEFIVVAATLMRIKAKLLLPRKDIDATGNEIDPRDELVAKLLEYKKFKEVQEQMRQLEDTRAGKYERGNAVGELKVLSESLSGEAELHTLTLFRLLKAFEKVMTRYEEDKNKPVHKVIQYAYSIEGSRDKIMEVVRRGSNVPFIGIFEHCENRIHAIFTFLAMLELIQSNLININIGMGANNFWVSTTE